MGELSQPHARLEVWRVVLRATLVLAVGVAFLPKPVALWVSVAGGALLTGLIATRVARAARSRGWLAARRHPLTLLGLSLVCTVGGELLHAAGAHTPSRADAVSMGAYPLVLLVLLRLTRAQVRERTADTLLVAAIVPVCLLTFGWFPFAGALHRWGPVAAGDNLLPAAFLAVDALAVAMTARLALLLRGKPFSSWLLLGAFSAMLGAHTARAAAVLTHVSPAPVGTQSLMLIGFGLLGAAALHPSLGPGSEPASRPAPLGRRHVLMLAAAVAVGPVVVTLRYADQGRWVFLAVGGPAVVSLLVVAHLWRIVQERSRLEHLSLHDPLTGLPNRVWFRDRLEQAASGGDGFAVGLIDLDRFKKINDSLGHAAGDELLRQVASRLHEAARYGDTVARLSGDEFAFLVLGVDQAAGRVVSDRLHDAFRDRFHLAGRDVYMSPSIGIAVFPAHGDDPDTLLRHADLAMYEAKSAGGDAVHVFDDRLRRHLHQDLALETALHAALERDELVLHYQPKLRLETGELVGVEALVRWEHPDVGLIPPGAFIRVAEESGLIAPLGEWVLREACRQAAEWLAAGARVPVSVNLSARQFQQDDLAGLVAAVLREHRLPCELLELELTESLSLDEQDTVMSTLAELRSLGVRCSIDDFGTGYSGLSYLSRYPIDFLKLDRSFVSTIEDGDAPIVRAIIAMAHSLDLEVVAEGVETPGQAAFLREQGCDILQGFLASKPVLPDQVLDGTGEWIALAARSWRDGRPSEHGAAGVIPAQARWDERVLGERLASLEPVVVPQRVSPAIALEEEREPRTGGHVQRTLVLSGAASLLTLPVLLGLGAANALPAHVQAMVDAGLQTGRITVPRADPHRPAVPRPRAPVVSARAKRGAAPAPGPAVAPTDPTTAVPPAARQHPSPKPGAGGSGRGPVKAGGGKGKATGKAKATGKPSGTGKPSVKPASGKAAVPPGTAGHGATHGR